MSLTIIEIKKRKHELEDEIGRLLAKFERESHTKVEGFVIDRTRVEDFGEEPKEIMGEIQITVVIP